MGQKLGLRTSALPGVWGGAAEGWLWESQGGGFGLPLPTMYLVRPVRVKTTEMFLQKSRLPASLEQSADLRPGILSPDAPLPQHSSP